MITNIRRLSNALDKVAYASDLKQATLRGLTVRQFHIELGCKGCPICGSYMGPIPDTPLSFPQQCGVLAVYGASLGVGLSIFVFAGIFLAIHLGWISKCM